MNTLITGGTGFIGSRLALKCLQRGHRVSVVGQENTRAESENRKLLEAHGARVMLASVTDREKLCAATRGVDLVFHLAAAQHEANVPEKRFWDVNVGGTKNILEACAVARVQRFVHGSTIGVYGWTPGCHVNEASELEPDNIYGVTKLAAERLVLSWQHKLPAIIVRISETYGPGDMRLLKLFKAIKKRTFFLIGSGRNMHHPIYIDDLTEDLVRVGTAEDAVGKTIVLAGREALSTKDMVHIVAAQLGGRIPDFHLPLAPFVVLAVLLESLLRPLGIQPPVHRRRLDFFRKSYMFAQDNAFECLGFTPRYNFREGIEHTAKWYREIGRL